MIIMTVAIIVIVRIASIKATIKLMCTLLFKKNKNNSSINSQGSESNAVVITTTKI